MNHTQKSVEIGMTWPYLVLIPIPRLPQGPSNAPSTSPPLSEGLSADRAPIIPGLNGAHVMA